MDIGYQNTDYISLNNDIHFNLKDLFVVCILWNDSIEIIHLKKKPPHFNGCITLSQYSLQLYDE